jgi:hypothetical protein
MGIKNANIQTGTSCAEPPDPDSSTQLVSVWDGNLIVFDTPIDYTCLRGQKFKSDITLEKQVAYCKEENIWDYPSTWEECVESEFITVWICTLKH